MSKTAFTDMIYNKVCDLIETCGYHRDCAFAITAQAVLESGWNGESQLASRYNNFFGMKSGGSWRGKSVNLKTKEEYDGCVIDIRDNFRVYENPDCCVIGYFDFIQARRYQNLHDCKTAEQYAETIRADGYATSSAYVSSLLKIIKTLRGYYGDTAPEESVYYPQYHGDSQLLDVVFSAVGAPYGNWKARNPVAQANGISAYTGTYEQNIKLLSLAKMGKLKKC